ncbi:unnamed protein product [Lampetra planeri]
MQPLRLVEATAAPLGTWGPTWPTRPPRATSGSENGAAHVLPRPCEVARMLLPLLLAFDEGRVVQTSSIRVQAPSLARTRCKQIPCAQRMGAAPLLSRISTGPVNPTLSPPRAPLHVTFDARRFGGHRDPPRLTTAKFGANLQPPFDSRPS